MMPSLSELYTAFDSEPTGIVAFLQTLASTYELPQPLSVLDVGCGPGRLLLPLERLRWDVVGMEPNSDFLAAARRAAASSRRVRVRRGGFLDVDEREAFDLVVAVNSSFAHLTVPAERAEALQRIYHALRPGGVVFLDLPNFLWILKNYRAPEQHTLIVHGQEVTLCRRHEIDYHRATLTTTDEYVFAGRQDPTVEMVHTYGMTSLPEIDYHFQRVGLEDVRTFNGYGSRSAEHLSGPRMLITARRPTP